MKRRRQEPVPESGRRMHHGRGAAVAVLCGAIVLGTSGRGHAAAPPNALRQLDSALKDLTAQVSPAVVQVLVTGYGPLGRETPGEAVVYARQQALGSGVILDPSGYIITNAHVVKGAERVHVVLTRRAHDPAVPWPPGEEPVALPATVVGLTDRFDLALLKVEATDLPTLPLADFRDVSEGQVVIAIGSPLGLENSVTMGILSSVARQARPDSPVVFVQTDAPINPGSSGGALVDVSGRLVGINTFILSQAGGNEGLGFAVPAPVVQMAYESLRQKGHVDRRVIGVAVQRITPVLAKGLGLARDYGLVVCDLLPGAPGEAAGLKVGDLVVAADGRPISTPAQLDGSIYLHDTRRPLRLDMLRDGAPVALDVTIVEESHRADALMDPSEVRRNLVPQLGVIAAAVTAEVQSRLGNLRIPSGVVVVARTTEVPGLQLSPGDVIHAVNASPVTDLDALRSELARLDHGAAVVLQVERRGGLEFVAFEMT